MRRIILGMAILPAILLCSAVAGQDLDRLQRPADQSLTSDQVAQTEDMWFYLQELRRYDDPQVIIRRKARKKADQRRQRLAAMKWYGYSQGRPPANPTPSMGYYSPMWAGNGYDPFVWIGNAYVPTAVRVDGSDAEPTASR